MSVSKKHLSVSKNRFGKITSKSLQEIALLGVVSATKKTGSSLPCLYSNNSTENILNSLRFDSLEAAQNAAFQLNTQIRKKCFMFGMECRFFVQQIRH